MMDRDITYYLLLVYTIHEKGEKNLKFHYKIEIHMLLKNHRVLESPSFYDTFVFLLTSK